MQDRNEKDKPDVAPGLYEPDELEQEASENEKRRGDVTEVTKLYLDRTPED